MVSSALTRELIRLKYYERRHIMHLSINLGVDTLKNSDLELNELIILAIIYSYERNEKPCNLKRSNIAKYMNVSEWAIQRLYTSLKKKNYIFITRQTKKLTQKGITLCQKYFAYKLTKRQKKEQRMPAWYANYQEQLKQEQVSSKQVNMTESEIQAQKKQASIVFGNDYKTMM